MGFQSGNANVCRQETQSVTTSASSGLCVTLLKITHRFRVYGSTVAAARGMLHTMCTLFQSSLLVRAVSWDLLMLALSIVGPPNEILTLGKSWRPMSMKYDSRGEIGSPHLLYPI